MRDQVMRCPIRRERMVHSPEAHLVDCPARHRVCTDADVWHPAHLRMLIEELEALTRPADRVVDHEHHWVTVERTRYESLDECASCAVWRMGPPQSRTW